MYVVVVWLHFAAEPHADMLMLVQASRRMPSKVLSWLHGSTTMESLHMCACAYRCVYAMPYDSSTRTQREHGHRTMMLMTACTENRDRSPLPCLALRRSPHVRSTRERWQGWVFPTGLEQERRGGEAYTFACCT